MRHATTAETRRAAFPVSSGAAPTDEDPPLDRHGRDQAAALRGHLPAPDRVWTSHAARAVDTARLAGLDGGVAEPDLAEGDFGRWAGRTPLEVATEEPDLIAAWYADLGSAPHGGETFAQVAVRAGRVLARAAAVGGTTIAVTHGGFIRAALLGVLDLPVTALWRLDAAPASVAELHPAGGVVAAATMGAGDRGVTAVVEAVEDAVPDDPGSWRVVRVNWTPTLTGPPAAPGVGAPAAPGVGAPAAPGVGALAAHGVGAPAAPGVGAPGVSHTPAAHTPADPADEGRGEST